ncbi:MAG: terminase small subunit [Huintestinicola sp.]
MKISRDRILREISAAAYSDFTDYVSVETRSDGSQALTVTDTTILRPKSKRAVASIKAGTRGIEIKLYDKLKALELLGRTVGLFGDRAGNDDELLQKLGGMLEDAAGVSEDSSEDSEE